MSVSLRGLVFLLMVALAIGLDSPRVMGSPAGSAPGGASTRRGGAESPGPTRVLTPSPCILLHVKSPTSRNPCDAGRLNDPAVAVTAGDLSRSSGPFHYVYLLVARGGAPDIAGVQCGIDYQDHLPENISDGAGVDVFGWTLCASLEFVSPGPHQWPAPGGGNLITWSQNNCQTGPTCVAGYFYVGAYSRDRLKLIPRPIDGAAKVALCDASESDVPERRLGYASFSARAVQAGCNPWLVNCSPPSAAERSNWNFMKIFNKSR